MRILYPRFSPGSIHHGYLLDNSLAAVDIRTRLLFELRPVHPPLACSTATKTLILLIRIADERFRRDTSTVHLLLKFSSRFHLQLIARANILLLRTLRIYDHLSSRLKYFHPDAFLLSIGFLSCEISKIALVS